MRHKGESEALGAIDNDTVYPLQIFMQRAGLGKHAMAQLRRQGLPVRVVGSRRYVRGKDFSDFIGNQSGIATDARPND